VNQEISAQRLLLQLTAYFLLLLFGSVFWLGIAKPDLLSMMPFGGTDALQVAGIELGEQTDAGKFSLTAEPTVYIQPTARQKRAGYEALSSDSSQKSP